MPEIAAMEELTNLRIELYGNTPRRFENDIGDIGNLKKSVEDIKDIKKTLAFLKGTPGIIVKLAGIIIALKQILDFAMSVHGGK